MLKTGHITRTIVFSEFSSGHFEQLQSFYSFWKNISKCLKQQWSDTITENQQYVVYKWRYMSDMRHGMKKANFVQNFPLIMLNNFYHERLFPKTKFQGLKRQSSGKINENDKMTSLNHVSHQKREMIWKEYFFQNVSLMMIINFNHNRNIIKKVKVLKTA